jgi:hypothetical protein
MPNTKPFVAAAFVCEQVIQEKDGVLSAVRIVDTYFILPPPSGLPPNVKPGISLTVLVSVKSGDVKGTFQAKFKLRTPQAKTIALGTPKSMVLNGGEHGANWIVKFEMPAEELGLYWFDFYWDDDVLTSIPLKLAPQQRPVETQVTG